MKKYKKIIITFLICLICYASSIFISKINLDINDNVILFLTSNSNSIISSRHLFNYRFNIKDIINYEYKFFNYNKDNKAVRTFHKISNPTVYIYNTHQKEEYYVNKNEPYNIVPTVLTTSYMLQEILSNYNILSIVEEGSISNILESNNWNYASSYIASRMLLNKAKENYDSLKFYIDIHRDSVAKDISTVTINDKKYAKVMFLIGLENPNYKENLKIVEVINNELNSKYKGLSRGIYKKSGPKVNGVYNQDFSSNCMLIEVGGSENTIEEVYNTIEILGGILSNYIGDTNEKI